MFAHPKLSGKREALARVLFASGVPSALLHLPPQDSLIVLNYHRIGDPAQDLFDPGVFSATGNEFDEQIAHLKKTVRLVTLEEAQAFISGTEGSGRPVCRVLITFDDGYLDNYQLAFPVLRSHGVQGVFFLATGIVGSCAVPWWDQIAYILKTARNRRFSLRYPAALEVDFALAGLLPSLQAVLKLFKRQDNSDQTLFMRELAEAAGGDAPPTTLRRFLDWDEAREMIAGGMAIGSHTHSHPVLSQLQPARQLEELKSSRQILEEQLGKTVTALAYPVGAQSSFDGTTERLAQEAGYRTAFSFFGGINQKGATRPYDVRRIGVDRREIRRFQLQVAMARTLGKFWP